MWLLAWTIDHGNNELEDFWSIHETEEEARAALQPLLEETKLHCWAVCPIKEGSEFHWNYPDDLDSR